MVGCSGLWCARVGCGGLAVVWWAEVYCGWLGCGWLGCGVFWYGRFLCVSFPQLCIVLKMNLMDIFQLEHYTVTNFLQ